MAKVNIEGKQYDTDALSPEARDLIQNVQYCDEKMAELKREMAVLQTARNTYARALQAQLPKDA